MSIQRKRNLPPEPLKAVPVRKVAQLSLDTIGLSDTKGYTVSQWRKAYEYMLIKEKYDRMSQIMLSEWLESHLKKK